MVTDDKGSDFWYLFSLQTTHLIPAIIHINATKWENPRREGDGLAQLNTGGIKILQSIWLIDGECPGSSEYMYIYTYIFKDIHTYVCP